MLLLQCQDIDKCCRSSVLDSSLLKEKSPEMCSASAGVSSVPFVVAHTEICFVVHLMVTLAGLVIVPW